MNTDDKKQPICFLFSNCLSVFRNQRKNTYSYSRIHPNIPDFRVFALQIASGIFRFKYPGRSYHNESCSFQPIGQYIGKYIGLLCSHRLKMSRNLQWVIAVKNQVRSVALTRALITWPNWRGSWDEVKWMWV